MLYTAFGRQSRDTHTPILCMSFAMMWLIIHRYTVVVDEIVFPVLPSKMSTTKTENFFNLVSTI